MAPKTTRRGALAAPASRKRHAKFVRPRCVQLEDRLAPALFNVKDPALSFSGLNNNGCVATADLDKNGHMDAILTNYGTAATTGDGNTITILYGTNNTGGFTRVAVPTNGTNVSFVAVADINNDTWLDVVAVNGNRQGTGTVTVWKNDNGNLIQQGSPIPTAGNNSSWVGLADVTSDNVLDLIVASFGRDDGAGGVEGNNVTILEGSHDGAGNGNFSFTGPITTLNPELQFVPTALAVADFDSDGANDIVAVSPGVPPDFGQPYPNGTIYAFKGNGAGGFGSPSQFDTAGVFPVNVQAADLRGNGKMDLIIANAGDPQAASEFTGNSVGVLLNTSSSNSINFGVPNSLTANCYGTFAVAAADFDLNGKMDIASINYGSVADIEPNAFVSLYMGNGSGGFAPGSPGTYDTMTSLPGGQYLAIGDFDSNSTPDLVVAHANNRVGLMFNTSVAVPTVTINQAAGQSDPTNGSSIAFTVDFSEGVTGFDSTDVDLSASSGGGAGMSATVTPISSTKYTVTVNGYTGTGFVKASIPAGAATSIASGQASLASTSSDNQVNFDLVKPSVTIDQAAGQADPTTTGPILFTVIFSENVTGFTAADVDLSASSLSGLSATVTGSGTTYTVSVTGMTGNGTVVAKVPANAATDAAGNTNSASTSSDNTVTFGSASTPTVTINQAAGQVDPTNASPIAFAVQFNQPVTGFDDTDINFTGSTVGGTLVANVSGSGATYTVTVTGMTGTGTVVASIPAGAAQNAFGTGSAASTSSDNSVTFDGVAPTVTINKAVGQDDPTSGPSIKFDVKFSEPVTGFSASDVSLAGSTVGGTLNVSVSGSGDTYVVTVTGMTSRGTVVASIPGGAANDAAGNPSAASTSGDNTVEFVNAGTIGLSQAIYNTTEDATAHSVTITVTRSGDTEGAVSINYGTTDGTAHSGGSATTGQADYTPTSGTLSWADGEGGSKTFTIDILPDNLNEGKELINLALTNAVGGPALGITNATVAIGPSDGKVIDALARVPTAVFRDGFGFAGDIITVRLAGLAGTATVYLTDPDGDGTGPLELIDLANTVATKSRLVITSRKPLGGAGDGRAKLGEVTGSGLLVMNAATTDLNGPGINLNGFLQTLRIGNISGGADINIMGPPPPSILPRVVRITAGVITDGTDITVPAKLALLNAISVGDGSITAPSIGQLIARGKAKTLLAPAVPGNFNSDVEVTGVGVDPLKLALTRLRAAGNIAGSFIDVHGNLGAISVGNFISHVGDVTGANIKVAGNVNAIRVAGKVDQTTVDVTANVMAVTVGSFWNSRLDAGYTGPDDGSGTYDLPALISSFVVTSKTNGFQSSNVIASTINNVVLASVNGNNGGVKFGFTADQALRALRVTSPATPWVFNPLAPSPQGTPLLPDFQANDRNGPG
jgi:Calx-beta domain/Bacterial Ig-like domain/FG-GAP-like repeat